jgi:hypothetical protein
MFKAIARNAAGQTAESRFNSGWAYIPAEREQNASTLQLENMLVMHLWHGY